MNASSRSCAAERPIVPHESPQSIGPGAPEAGRQHRNRRAVPMDFLCGEHMGTDAIGDWRQQPRCLAGIIGERRAGQINTFARINFTLPIQRQIIEIFRHHDHREQRGCRTATRDRQVGSRSLRDRIAALAGIFRPDMPDHLEPAGNVVMHCLADYISANFA